MTKWVKLRPIFSFFTLTIILSWLVGFPAVFFPKWPDVLTLLMAFMPAVSAMIIAYLTKGTRQLSLLLASLKKWHIPWYWYAIVLLFPAVTMVTTIMVFSKSNKLILDSSFPLLHLNLSQIFFLLGIFVYQLVIVWGEELGWRGFALPELQKKFHPIIASIILGFLWGIWHLPYFFMEGSAQENIPFGFLFCLQPVIPFSIVLYLMEQMKAHGWLAYFTQRITLRFLSL